MPPLTGPNLTLAVLIDRSVAKLTIALRPTRSVRYGYRVRLEDGGGGAVTGAVCGEVLPAMSSACRV